MVVRHLQITCWQKTQSGVRSELENTDDGRRRIVDTNYSSSYCYIWNSFHLPWSPNCLENEDLKSEFLSKFITLYNVQTDVKFPTTTYRKLILWVLTVLGWGLDTIRGTLQIFLYVFVRLSFIPWWYLNTGIIDYLVWLRALNTGLDFPDTEERVPI